MNGPFKMKGYSYPGTSPLKQDDGPDLVIQAIMNTPENERSEADKKALRMYKAKKYQKKRDTKKKQGKTLEPSY